MSYNKTIWTAGDTITAEKLNNLETGVSEAFIAPPIEGTDVGKVLGVTQDAEENPVYGLVEQSGGNNDFVVTLTFDPNDEGHWSSDKTATEIIAAIRSGHHAYATYRVDTTSVGGPYDIMYAYLVRYADTGTPTVTFSETQIYQEGVTNKLLTSTFIISDDAVTQQIKMIS